MANNKNMNPSATARGKKTKSVSSKSDSVKTLQGEIARWNRHRFRVTSRSIRGFRELTIKGATETEDKVGAKQKFVHRKNSKATEVTMTALLAESIGCSVKKEAMAFVEEAYAGKTGYLYFGGKKLMTWALMLTDATVKDVVLSPKGEWLSCNVALTFKQSSQKNGSTEGKVVKDSSSSKKKSTKKSGSKSGKKSGGGGGGSGSKGGSGKVFKRSEGKSGHTTVPVRFSPGVADAAKTAKKATSESRTFGDGAPYR